ncbi:MAG TPA: dynamin family protein [Rhizomicrobium sp.]|nr:dynamin family protein [Rhizomicrobium sp.]
MDIKEYERAKFDLADILRSVSPAARATEPDNFFPFEDLFARLAEDRFNIVIAGQFNRGKTSLMNAMLNTERLPTGIVPLTSVITTVQYGTDERAILEYEERRLPSEISVSSLAQYITQSRNPGNIQRIRLARVELPAELLRRGFHLVDTPGLGSAILENTRTTEHFLPEADALVLVTSYDSPLSGDEIRLLSDWGLKRRRVFLVVNKEDLVGADERREVLEHVRGQIDRGPGGRRTEIFSLSARDAMKANASGNRDELVRSGLPRFVERLTAFLVEEKQSEFLRQMCQRIEERLSRLGGTGDELRRLAALRAQAFAPRADDPMPVSAGGAGAKVVPRFAVCQICHRVERDVHAFLRKYQYEIIINRKTREELAEAGGLCSFHTWQYACIASPHGTCVGFPGTIDRLARLLGKLAAGGGEFAGANSVTALHPAQARCIFCRTHAAAEGRALAKIVRLIAEAAENGAELFPDICLAHLPLVVGEIPDRRIVQKLLAAEAESLGMVADDMRRYALKRDGTRSALTTRDEANAHLRGLIALAGHADLNFPRGPE